jgi:fructose-bisphosphate aldolase class II
MELEIGITGGEEDGIDNSQADQNRLYTQPQEINATYEALSKISPNFLIAAAFGNVHGVYKPENVKLKPEILKKHQQFIQEKHHTSDKPLKLVFHGGSGSPEAAIKEAVSYGVVKFNIDTDTQWAFTYGIKTYFDQNKPYLNSQIGNPEGEDKPNKSYYDPRKWLFAGEKSIVQKLLQIYNSLNALNRN